MPLPTAPAWLTQREGSLSAGVRDGTVFVTFGAKPEYKLEVRPAKGKFSCVVTATVNGRTVDDGSEIYDSNDAAFAGGLTRLQTKLGW